MDAKDVEGIGRRNFLKYSGLALGASLTGLRPQPVFAAKQFGHSIVQQINHVKLYMTHYAFFEEPDPGVPNAVYFDAATGRPTSELFLSTPVSLRDFSRGARNRTVLAAPSETSKLLPYVVEPPRFPAQSPPAPVVGFIEQVTGLPDSVIVPNTSVLLVAIGQFLSAGTTSGRLAGGFFSGSASSSSRRSGLKRRRWGCSRATSTSASCTSSSGSRRPRIRTRSSSTAGSRP